MGENHVIYAWFKILPEERGQNKSNLSAFDQA